MKRLRSIALVAALALPLAGAAALSEAEKQLLNAGMSSETAREAGKAADAAALERIVGIGDPNLVQSFSNGMQQARIDQLPGPVEALVVKHYDDPRVGEALRRFGRYQTRALFDLHYARVQVAYKSDDPVFEQILRTDQPGVDEALLKIAARFPTRSGDVNPVALFAGRHKHPGAIPMLMAALPGIAANGSLAMSMLLDYDDPELWRRVSAEVDRLKAEGKVSDAAYARARMSLDPMIKDPEGIRARRSAAAPISEFSKRRAAITPPSPAQELLTSDPKRYIAERVRYIEQEEAIAAELRSESVDRLVAGDYSRLGAAVRFAANDPRGAIRYLEKGAKGGDMFGQFLLADTYEIALKDKANAVRAYQLALDTVNAAAPLSQYGPAGRPLSAFWKGWYTAQIAALTGGKPFRGRVSEAEVEGLWTAMSTLAGAGGTLLPGWPWLYDPASNTSAPSYSGRAIVMRGYQPPPADWSSVAGISKPKDLAVKLQGLQASHLSLVIALQYVSLLPDADAILREFARHDPGGYWTTVILGTVAFHESGDAARRDAALSNNVAITMPGMAATGRPNALATAAKRYLQSRELRIVENK